MPHPGWIDVAGGKLTTYRLMAEQTVDLVGRHLKADLEGVPLPASRCSSFGGLLQRVLPPPVAGGGGTLPRHEWRGTWTT